MSPVRRALLALVVAAAPVLQLVGFALHPALPDTPQGLVDVVAADPGRWVVTHLAAAVSAALSVLAAPVLAGLVRGRGAGLATTGAAMAAAGGTCLAIAFGAEAQLLALAVDPAVGRDAAVALARLEHTGAAASLLPAGFPLVGLGTLLLAGGLLRSGAVPRWQPALVLLGTVASLAGSPGSDVGPFLLAPAVLGQLGLAGQVLRGRRPAAPAPGPGVRDDGAAQPLPAQPPAAEPAAV